MAANAQAQARAARNVDAYRRTLWRNRLDYRWLPDGRIEAILTVTLPHGAAFRFSETCHPEEIATWIRENRPEVAGFLGKLWKGVKKVAKKVATSKVFSIATKALAFAAPILGPLAPAALAASVGLKATTMLIGAQRLKAVGNAAGALKLVKAAGALSSASPLPKLPAPAQKPAPRPGQLPMMASTRATKPLVTPTRSNPIPAMDVAHHEAKRVYRLMLMPI